MRVDLHAELRRIENSGPADSAPYFTRLARFSFTCAGPLRKKGGRNFFLATWKCFFRRSMFLRLVSGLRLTSIRLLFLAVLSGTLTCPHPPPSQASLLAEDV